MYLNYFCNVVKWLHKANLVPINNKILKWLGLNHANTDTRCTIAHGCLCKLVLMQKTHIFAQFCQVTTTLELDMGREQFLSLVLLLFLRSFILPCQGKPRGGRGGGRRGGGRGGRGGGGWRWFGGSSYSSGSLCFWHIYYDFFPSHNQCNYKNVICGSNFDFNSLNNSNPTPDLCSV